MEGNRMEGNRMEGSRVEGDRMSANAQKEMQRRVVLNGQHLILREGPRAPIGQLLPLHQVLAKVAAAKTPQPRSVAPAEVESRKCRLPERS
eukprot:scaffold1411_cov252-Pinguiococcus_pyrenoidosus.AAC.7